MRQSHSIPVWAIVGIAAAIALVGLLTAETLRTTAFATKDGSSVSQPPAAETAPAKAEVEQTKYDITPSPVIEPNPKFFIGAGDGSNGSYDEPQHR
jgi:hypothetical protein